MLALGLSSTARAARFRLAWPRPARFALAVPWRALIAGAASRRALLALCGVATAAGALFGVEARRKLQARDRTLQELFDIPEELRLVGGHERNGLARRPCTA